MYYRVTTPKQAAIAMLRKAGWVVYFLPREVQKEFFGE